MRLLRSTAIIGSLTLVSRLLGLVRDILIARFLGAGVVSDAFFTAFKLPNVFRRMFAEGAFNAAFIPLYAKRIEEDGETAADGFASEAAAALFFIVAILVIAFELTMPWSLNIIGSSMDKTTIVDGITPYDLAVLYAWLTMPYLLFMSMTALFSGILFCACGRGADCSEYPHDFDSDILGRLRVVTAKYRFSRLGGDYGVGRGSNGDGYMGLPESGRENGISPSALYTGREASSDPWHSGNNKRGHHAN